MELHIYELPYDLKVSTPTEAFIMSGLACLNLDLKYDICDSKVYLICLLLKGIDIMICMDWLSANIAHIDCKGKKVNFPSCLASIELASSPLLLFITQVEKCTRQGCVAYMNFFSISANKEVRINQIEVVNEFLELFLKEISRFPPKQEV